jgi:cysteinyl-tRNA synthetase
MYQTQIGIGIMALILMNGVILVWTITQVSKLRHNAIPVQNFIPAPKPHPTVLVSPAEKHHLEQVLAERAKTEIQTILSRLNQAIKGFSEDLQTKLSADATKSIADQLAAPQQTIQAFNDALTHTLADINQALEETGRVSQAQLANQLSQQKAALVEQFENHMAVIIGNYLVTALGQDSIDNDQTSRIIKQLETNKADLRKDLLREA